MSIADKTILITGASRGIGRALADEALRRGAERVYAAARQAGSGPSDERVTPLTLDVTDAAQVPRGPADGSGRSDILSTTPASRCTRALGDRARSSATWPSTCSAPNGAGQLSCRLCEFGGAIVNMSREARSPRSRSWPHRLGSRR